MNKLRTLGGLLITAGMFSFASGAARLVYDSAHPPLNKADPVKIYLDSKESLDKLKRRYDVSTNNVLSYVPNGFESIAFSGENLESNTLARSRIESNIKFMESNNSRVIDYNNYLLTNKIIALGGLFSVFIGRGILNTIESKTKDKKNKARRLGDFLTLE